MSKDSSKLENARFVVQFEHDPAGRYPYLPRREQRLVESQMQAQIRAVLPRRQIQAWEDLPEDALRVTVGRETLPLDPDTESTSLRGLRLFMDQLLAAASLAPDAKDSWLAAPPRAPMMMSAGSTGAPAATGASVVALSTNHNVPIDAYCQVNRQTNKHVDGVRCPLMLGTSIAEAAGGAPLSGAPSGASAFAALAVADTASAAVVDSSRKVKFEPWLVSGVTSKGVLVQAWVVGVFSFTTTDGYV